MPNPETTRCTFGRIVQIINEGNTLHGKITRTKGILNKRNLLQNSNNEPDNTDTMLSALALSRFGIGAASLVAILGLSFMGVNCCGGSGDDDDGDDDGDDDLSILEASVKFKAEKDNTTYRKAAKEAADLERKVGDSTGRNSRALTDAAESLEKKIGRDR